MSLKFDSPTDMDPLFASEATVSLYPYQSDGVTPDTASPVWLGAAVEGVRMSAKYQKVRIAGTGDAYHREKIVAEEHQIAIARVWLKRAGSADVAFDRTKDYALVIAFVSEHRPAVTHTRTYHFARPDDRSLDSDGVHEFKENQGFTAQYYVAS